MYTFVRRYFDVFFYKPYFIVLDPRLYSLTAIHKSYCETMFLRFLASEYQLLERDDTAFRNKPIHFYELGI